MAVSLRLLRRPLQQGELPSSLPSPAPSASPRPWGPWLPLSSGRFLWSLLFCLSYPPYLISLFHRSEYSAPRTKRHASINGCVAVPAYPDAASFALRLSGHGRRLFALSTH